MKRSKKPRDINTLGHAVVDEATMSGKPQESQKNPAAVELGRLEGGKDRARKLSAKRRSEIARRAALVRWRKA